MARRDFIIARIWTVVVTTVRRAAAERVPEAAASVGFFAVFSFFPFLLILVSVASTVLSNVHTQQQILRYIVEVIPVSREFVSANMQVVLRARGAVGLIGLAGLLWSATSAFSVLERNLNRAWPTARRRGALSSRLVALAVVACLTGMSVLFLALKAGVPLATNWALFAEFTATFAEAFELSMRATIVACVFGSTVLLYRLVPAARVAWRDAMMAAAVATAASTAATGVFTWYLNSGLARYNLVYGSLGALVALLAWVYVLVLIALVGGHLCASLKAERVSPAGAGES